VKVLMALLSSKQIAALTLFIVVTASVPVFGGTYAASILIIVLSFIALVSAWQIISGYAGYILLGSAAFYGLGMYMSALLTPILTLYGAIPASAAVCFAAALGLGVPFLRIKGPYFIIATLALGELIRNIVTFTETNYFRTLGRITIMYDLTTILYLLIINAVAVILAVYFIKNSKFGLGLMSIKNDEIAAESCGIPTTKYKLLAFGITAVFMGSTGAIMASRAGYIDPDIAFPAYISIYTLVMGIIGGLGNLIGGIVSAIILTLLFEIFLSMGNPYPFGILLGILLILSVLLRGKRVTLLRIFRMQKITVQKPLSPAK